MLDKEQGNLDDIIAYRIECADDALNAAKLLFDAGSLRAAANRLYYALYYGVSAALLKRGMAPKTHAGMLTLFNKEFVKSEIFSIDDGALLRHCMMLRQSGDYLDFIDPDKAELAILIPLAEDFILRIKKTSKQEGFGG